VFLRHTADPIKDEQFSLVLGQNNGVSIKRDAMGLSFAVGLYGSAFGAAAVANHFSVAQACFLSLVLFSGASQFAVVGVIGAGGTSLNAIGTGSLLGLRNALYSLRMKPILNLKGFKRLIGAQLTIDESTGISLAQKNQSDSVTGFWLTGIGVYFWWNFFTLIGALGAQSIGNPSQWGLDSAVPAAFLALVWPRLKDKKSWTLAISAILISLLLTPIFPAGLPIISCALLALAFGWRE
jgi:predicted branched-subunit amino acid permease